MIDAASPNLLAHLWKSTLLSGILIVVLGVLVLFWPGKSILVAAVLFGIYLLVTGVAQVFAAFSLPVASGATQRSQHP